MVMPLAVRLVAAVAGGLLVLAAWASVTETLIVSRSVGGWLTRWVDRIVNGAFGLATGAIPDYRRRDRLLATQPAAILLTQLAAWLGIFFAGSRCCSGLAPRGGIGFHRCRVLAVHLGVRRAARRRAGGDRLPGFGDGLVIVTLQIAYLPTLYSAFNRRETEVALLRAGWHSVVGPELLARTHYALGTGCRPWIRSPACTPSGNAGPPTSPKATPPTCRWYGSAHPCPYPPG